MVDEKVTTASQWKGRRGSPIELPSGNIALLRRPGIDHYLRTGAIPNSLKNTIRSAMGKNPQAKMDDLLEDEDSMMELFGLMDRIMIEVVVDPKVRPVPLDDSGRPILLDDRDPDFIYTDEVDLEDKTFIFQYAMGGTKDLERFRREQSAGVGTLPAREGMENEAQ